MINPAGVLAVISGGGMPQIENAIGIIKAIYASTYCRFDEMYGTSAGALVSALNMSFGQDIERFENIIKTTDPTEWFKIKRWQAFKSILGLSNYVADNTALKDFLIKGITQEAIDRVKCAVTELDDCGEASSILCDGQPRNILASMSFQGIFPPVIWNGCKHVDGGVFNNCPLPRFQDIQQRAHVYIILNAAHTTIVPRMKGWKFVDNILSMISTALQREVHQIYESGITDLPNVTIFQPDRWVESAGFLNWSHNFEQIDASYNYALDVLEQEMRR